jgi:hypothetical protein
VNQWLQFGGSRKIVTKTHTHKSNYWGVGAHDMNDKGLSLSLSLFLFLFPPVALSNERGRKNEGAISTTSQSISVGPEKGSKLTRLSSSSGFLHPAPTSLPPSPFCLSVCLWGPDLLDPQRYNRLYKLLYTIVWANSWCVSQIFRLSLMAAGQQQQLSFTGRERHNTFWWCLFGWSKWRQPQ